MKQKTKKQSLQQKAIHIMQERPNITISEFAEVIGKRYSHAASLMSFARKNQVRSLPSQLTQSDKMLGLLSIDFDIKGRKLRTWFGVGAARISQLKKNARQRLSDGNQPKRDAIAWAESCLKKQSLAENEVPSKQAPAKPKMKDAKPAVTAKQDVSGAMSVQSVQRQPRDPEDLIRASGLEPADWTIASQIINVWEMGAKHPETGEILVEPLFQTKVRLEPLGGVNGVMEAMRQMIEDVRTAVCPLPAYSYPAKKDGHLVEISIPDLHLGKFSDPLETGETYNVEIACDLFRKAVADLIHQAKNACEIDRIVFPIGNDYLTADTFANTTSRGTAQDVSGHFAEHFRKGWQLLRETIESLRKIAPIDVMVVPGNHDSVASFALGEVLGAIYHDSEEVTIHHTNNQPRKYLSYGDILLGYAHGHLEKAQSLPMLMASEAAAAWGNSRHREIHVGHLHHTRDTHYLGTNEVDGVIVRVIPSLSASDRWHADKGYRSQRAALAFTYHPKNGQRGIFRHVVTDPLRIQVTNVA